MASAEMALGEEMAAPWPSNRMWPRAPGHGIGAGLLVADLSSMWEGLLCGYLLANVYATVVKAESLRRPDRTRAFLRRLDQQ
ncbi:CoA transferase [Mycobacterium lepromatosis]|uniref:CoA transferase n=2 Tax=Mycobacterium lepromatosis TaxID=480418 RepID=UPI0012E0655F|nr:CoA transferase [Mycobacterium lepromatosis]